MDAEEPALALDSVQRRVPFDRLTHAGDGAHDERVEAAPDLAFPARHGRNVGLHGGVTVGLRDLRVAACEECRLCEFAGPRLRCSLARHVRLGSDPLGGGLLCDLRRLLLNHTDSRSACRPNAAVSSARSASARARGYLSLLRWRDPARQARSEE